MFPMSSFFGGGFNPMAMFGGYGSTGSQSGWGQYPSFPMPTYPTPSPSYPTPTPTYPTPTPTPGYGHNNGSYSNNVSNNVNNNVNNNNNYNQNINQNLNLNAILNLLFNYQQPPVPVPPPHYPPPPPAPTYITGSAGVFGDPKFGLFTPDNLFGAIGPAPQALRDFQSGLVAGDTPTLLQDPDNGGFNVGAHIVDINGDWPSGNAIDRLVFNSGGYNIGLDASNPYKLSVLPNGSDAVSMIDFADGIDAAEQQLIATLQSHNTFVGTTNVDGRSSVFVSNPEYNVVATQRHPDQANPYFDVKFEERIGQAANNATGYVASGPVALSIPQLLNMEPNAQTQAIFNQYRNTASA